MAFLRRATVRTRATTVTTLGASVITKPENSAARTAQPTTSSPSRRRRRRRRHPRWSADKQSRVLQTLNPLTLASWEREYLTSISLQVQKFHVGYTIASTTLPKLDASSTTLAQTVARVQRSSSLIPRLSELLYQNPLQGFPLLPTTTTSRVVQQDINVLQTDSATGNQVLNRDVVFSMVLERLAVAILEDMDNIRNGLYPMPAELKLANSVGPALVSTTWRQLVDGLEFGLGHSTYSGEANYGSDSTQSGFANPPPSLYLQELTKNLNVPDYYMVDFHSVPGGFLNPQHPRAYDLVSNAVFMGCHFLVRRLAIRQIALDIQQRDSGSKGLKLLDLGTGNGSFLLQLQEMFPALVLHGRDLSPAMLEYAAQSFQNNDVLEKATAPRIVLTQGMMEDTPYDTESFEYVTQTNCFHEMPAYAIQDTAHEVARLLKPGGLFVTLDAMQRVDDPPVVESGLRTFSKNFNEPYIKAYMTEVDLDGIFAKAGLYPICEPRSYQAAAVRCYGKQ